MLDRTGAAPVELDAGQLLLRPWRPDDLPVVLAAHRDPTIHSWSRIAVDDPIGAAAYKPPVKARWATGPCPPPGAAAWPPRHSVLSPNWALGALGLYRLNLIHGVANEASCRIAARCGYLFDRELPPGDGWPDPGHLHVHLRDQHQDQDQNRDRNQNHASEPHRNVACGLFHDPTGHGRSSLAAEHPPQRLCGTS